MKIIPTLKTILLSQYFRVGVSIALLSVLFQWIDLNSFVNSITTANPYYLLTAVILMTANRILMPLKWNLLLRSHNLFLNWKDSVKIYYVSTFFGLFLPATVGADTLRTIYTKQRGISVEHGLASIMVERVLGALTTLTFGLLGGVLFILYFTQEQSDLSKLLSIALALLFFFIATFYLTLTTKFANFADHIAETMQNKGTLGSIIKALHKLYSAYALYRDRKGTMFIFILLTIIETAMPVIWSWLVALSIGINDVELIYYCTFVPLILLLIRLPISLDGFGINEGAYVYFLTLVGVSTSAAFSVGFITHILFLACLLPGILIYLLSSSEFSSPKKPEVRETN